MTNIESEIPELIAEKKVIQNPLYVLAWKVIEEEDFVYCLEDAKFYNYRAGFWQSLYEEEMMKNISKRMPALNGMALPLRKQVIENVKVLKHLHLDRFNWTELLNLKNGMVNPYHGTIEEHDRIFNSTIQLDYKFEPEAQCPLWLKSLNEIFQGDIQKINLLQEWFGYCLVPDVKQKKALLLLGDSDSGKSTVLNILRAMIGAKNSASVPLKYLSNPQYTPMLINKLINIDADVDKNAASYEAEFKIITSGEPVSCNQKFVAAFDFVPKARIVLAANIFPKITDHSSAFYKRLLLLPCERIFEEHEKNRELANQIIGNELPGILNWSIEGLKRLNQRGRFEQYDFMRNAVQDLENENNPSNAFLEEFTENHFESNLDKGELYEKYKSWCKETNNYTLSQGRFASCVFKKYHKYTPKDARDTETRKRVWRNVRWVHSRPGDAMNKGWHEN